jgi:hypothetical protein
MPLDRREHLFLSLIIAGGSIAVGSSAGHALHQRGLVEIVRRRYRITTDGIEAITGTERVVAVPARRAQPNSLSSW